MWGSINPLKAGGPQEDGALQFSRKESGERLEETQTNLQMQGFRCQMLSSYNVSNCYSCFLSCNLCESREPFESKKIRVPFKLIEVDYKMDMK